LKFGMCFKCSDCLSSQELEEQNYKNSKNKKKNCGHVTLENWERPCPVGKATVTGDIKELTL